MADALKEAVDRLTQLCAPDRFVPSKEFGTAYDARQLARLSSFIKLTPMLLAALSAAEARERVLLDLINSPEVEDFMRGVPLEASHQVERFGADHDAGKEPLDWFWLIGYLAQKAATSALAGDVAKAKHHTISTAAALANWHRALSGGDNRMRPGIDPGARALTPETSNAE